MIDRVLGFTTLGGFAISAVLFVLRWYNVVNPHQDKTYRLFNLLFILAFGLAFITSVASGCRLVFYLTSKLAMGLRLGLSIFSAIVLLMSEGCLFVVGCLGMNFMGQ